jgi:hypothetical protein
MLAKRRRRGMENPKEKGKRSENPEEMEENKKT